MKSVRMRVMIGSAALLLFAAACGGDSGDPGAAGTTDYLFDPRTVRVAGGDVVAVRNGNTKTPHTFTVVGEDVDLELGPLEIESVTIDLSPGTYDLICRFHEELGMTGTLKVT